MLYMVVERFRDLPAMGARFQERGRMIPDGVIYHASWMGIDGNCCYQIMESSRRALLDEWISHWSDLVDFEVIEVLTSQEFWARRNDGATDAPGTVGSHSERNRLPSSGVRKNIMQSLHDALSELS